MTRFFLKVVAVAVPLLALALVQMLRFERSERRNEVVQTITEGAGGEIAVRTPVLVIQVDEVYPKVVSRVREVVRQGVVVKEEYSETLSETASRVFLVPPEDLQVAISSHVETRFIGIFPGRVQDVTLSMSGHYKIPAETYATHHVEGKSRVARTSVTLGFRTLRALSQFSVAKLRGESLRFEPAGRDAPFETTEALVGTALPSEQDVPFEFKLTLRGGSHISIHPLAANTTAKLTSNWPHPDFAGGLAQHILPLRHSISRDGSETEWVVSGLSIGLKRYFLRGDESDWQQFQDSERHSIGVNFVEPVDVFSRVERSLKYGVFLIGASLSLLWLFAVRAKTKTHVIQYVLMALSLVVFFLLLLSLSEKFEFVFAYSASALAVVVLNGVYLSGILQSWRGAITCTTPTAVCFGALYGLLVSEDQALLLGSVFVFSLLAAVMVTTRKLDWQAALKPG